VDAAVAITSQFVADGPVFWEEDADGTQRFVEVSGTGLAVDPGLELVVLVNGGTASASEILAGALQDAGRAALVGEQTFGKGTVQEWTQLPGQNGGFRLSIAKWLTRDKTWVHDVGLAPDVEVADSGTRFWPRLDDEVDAAEAAADAQLQRAISLLRAGASSTPADQRSPHTMAPSSGPAGAGTPASPTPRSGLPGQPPSAAPGS
jgi:carboxyl-terminal processing protease